MKAIIADYALDVEGIKRNVAVLIEKDKIVGVVPHESLRDFGVDETFGGSGYLLIPGLVNAHTHVAMNKFRGFGDDMPLDRWLKEVIWPMEKEWTEEEIYKWALIGIAEAVANGSTVINDHYFFAWKIAEAAEKLGVRAFIGQTMMDLVEMSIAGPELGFKFFKRWKKSDLVRATLAPHATDTVSRDLLMEVKEVAEKESGIIHMHVSQSKEEVLRVKKREKMLPVEYLKELEMLGENFMGVHGVYLSKDEVKIYAESGATLVHCPTSLAKLEGEIGPIIDLWKLGGRIALGNDCAVSNNSLDMILEMKFAAILNKVKARNPTKPTAKEVFYWATVGGAEALGLKAGLIKEGYLADLVLIDTKKLHFLPRENVLSHIVYSAKGSDVEKVFVGGELIYDQGRFLKTNEIEELLALE
ncbi:S-adenosylhomocysteine deaminase / Methylthioadenosine deaminase [Thermococcus sp. 2319x1]|uniref:amidohydrolase family protein n=1 Tax=Thermococcus sp. 2319x1 TaxID=1674923 RepID=UPI00073AC913|nr:amidohydrolase [Thermococcus sp. 2319x1]ALV62556.1 S-adenosylhomocysteine deaminase / Methylthioadenosine deaminase [Thermococcus sp. 2319x1]